MRKIKLVKIAVSLLAIFIFCAVISGVVILVSSLKAKEWRNIVSAIINLLFCSGMFISVYQLEKIIESISKEDIFNKKNIMRFNIISYPLYIIAIIMCFINNHDVGIQLLAFSEFFSIKLDTVIFFTLGCVASIMSYIFSEALRIKNNEKRLEEENKYTI